MFGLVFRSVRFCRTYLQKFPLPHLYRPSASIYSLCYAPKLCFVKFLTFVQRIFIEIYCLRLMNIVNDV